MKLIKTKKITSKSLISIDELYRPPIDINQVTNGVLMIRLKEYF